jgi:hypothetical protein
LNCKGWLYGTTVTFEGSDLAFIWKTKENYSKHQAEQPVVGLFEVLALDILQFVLPPSSQ